MNDGLRSKVVALMEKESSAAPQREPQVFTAMGRLEAALNELTAMTEILTDRLGAVLSHDTDEARMTPTPGLPEFRVPLAGRIISAVGGVDAVIEKLRETIARLEI